MHGANAKDLLVKVPPGTIVRARGDDDEAEPLAELLRPGDRFLVAPGGRGGRGNLAFKSARNTAPALAEFGEKVDRWMGGRSGSSRAGAGTWLGKRWWPKTPRFQVRVHAPAARLVTARLLPCCVSLCAAGPGGVDRPGAQAGGGRGHHWLPQRRQEHAAEVGGGWVGLQTGPGSKCMAHSKSVCRRACCAERGPNVPRNLPCLQRGERRQAQDCKLPLHNPGAQPGRLQPGLPHNSVRG